MKHSRIIYRYQCNIKQIMQLYLDYFFHQQFSRPSYLFYSAFRRTLEWIKYTSCFFLSYFYCTDLSIIC